MKRFQYPVILFFIICVLCSCTATKKNTVSTINAFAFDTYISITFYEEVPQEIKDGCLDMCKKYELIFSATNPDSELYKLNNERSMVCSKELSDTISLALEYCEMTDGAYDITIKDVASLWDFSGNSDEIPDEADIKKALADVNYKDISIDRNTVTLNNNVSIDLGSIAKGVIADSLKAYLKSNNVNHAIIDLGGNILLVGNKSDKEAFTIAVKKPFSDSAIGHLKLSDYSVVSTGTYERYFIKNDTLYHHVLNPKTGYPYNNGLNGVTIIGKSSAICDALSTSIFCMGKDKGLEAINNIPDYYAIFITSNGKVICSDGLTDNLHLTLY